MLEARTTMPKRLFFTKMLFKWDHAFASQHPRALCTHAAPRRVDLLDRRKCRDDPGILAEQPRALSVFHRRPLRGARSVFLAAHFYKNRIEQRRPLGTSRKSDLRVGMVRPRVSVYDADSRTRFTLKWNRRSERRTVDFQRNMDRTRSASHRAARGICDSFFLDRRSADRCVPARRNLLNQPRRRNGPGRIDGPSNTRLARNNSMDFESSAEHRNRRRARRNDGRWKRILASHRARRNLCCWTFSRNVCRSKTN